MNLHILTILYPLFASFSLLVLAWLYFHFLLFTSTLLVIIWICFCCLLSFSQQGYNTVLGHLGSRNSKTSLQRIMRYEPKMTTAQALLLLGGCSPTGFYCSTQSRVMITRSTNRHSLPELSVKFLVNQKLFKYYQQSVK